MLDQIAADGADADGKDARHLSLRHAALHRADDPGTEFCGVGFHPGSLACRPTYVQGALEGEARVVRAANGTQAPTTPTAVEPIPIGQEITLAAGDTVYYDGEAVQTERNDGDTPAVILVSNLRGADEPAREFVD